MVPLEILLAPKIKPRQERAFSDSTLRKLAESIQHLPVREEELDKHTDNHSIFGKYSADPSVSI